MPTTSRSVPHADRGEVPGRHQRAPLHGRSATRRDDGSIDDAAWPPLRHEGPRTRESTPHEDAEVQEVISGLRQAVKHLPCKFFYDQHGSTLFDRICAQPEYYLTRTETAILQSNIETIGDYIGEGALLVEFGSGSSVKTRILLEHLVNLAGYVPIDVSGEHLQQVARQLEIDFPHIPIWPVVGDYTRPVTIPARVLASSRRPVAFFPGSTIGNFAPEAAESFLRRTALLVGPQGGVLIGVDLEKDDTVLEAAYNDAAGITAEFNRNILNVINRRFGADFDPAAFDHRAIYNRDAGRIEMHLVANRPTTVTIADEPFCFAEGEVIVTEHSYKYRLEEFSLLARRAGFVSDEVWCDADRRFSVHLLSTSG